MRKQQAGFTLVELVMVIVILGILAATAVPRFINLAGTANQAAVDGIAGALGSASAINYASRSALNTTGVPIANCTDVASALDGGLNADYAITSAVIAANASATCTVTGPAPATTTSTFVGHGIL